MLQIRFIENIDLLLFSTLLCGVMFWFLHKQKNRLSHSTKLFQQMILAVAAAGLSETLAWVCAMPVGASFRPLHYLSNALFFSLNMLPAALGLRYLDYLVTLSKERNARKLWLFLAPMLMNVGFVIVNLFSDGFLFRIGDANTYHRGVAVYIGNAAALLFSAAVVLGLFRNRQMITGRVTQVILMLTLLPILGVVLQTLFFGLSFGVPGYTLGIFICFLLMERDELLKDPLTLLHSRVQMENRLSYKIRSREPFTAIMIDVNGFKYINDTFGHTAGDEVLKDVSRILVSSANFDDFVCRFGGDEFFVILESQKDVGPSYIKRIDQILCDYSAGKPYVTGLSFGCVYVNHSKPYDVDELVNLTDQLMYKDKETRRRQG